MKAQRTAFLWFLLVIGLSGCGSTPSTPSSTPTSPTPSTPSISISPVSAVAGDSDVALTVKASGGLSFVNAPHNTSVIVWSANGSNTNLTTTFVSSTKLTAAIPAALLANPEDAQVLVETGDPEGSSSPLKSKSVGFSVLTPQPSINSISPTDVAAGSPDITLTISGSGFNQYDSLPTWSANGYDISLSITSITATRITAVIPAALLTKPITADITVQTWRGADSFPTAVSNAVDFSVNAP
jgi:hypothetical protein